MKCLILGAVLFAVTSLHAQQLAPASTGAPAPTSPVKSEAELRIQIAEQVVTIAQLRAQVNELTFALQIAQNDAVIQARDIANAQLKSAQQDLARAKETVAPKPANAAPSSVAKPNSVTP